MSNRANHIKQPVDLINDEELARLPLEIVDEVVGEDDTVVVPAQLQRRVQAYQPLWEAGSIDLDGAGNVQEAFLSLNSMTITTGRYIGPSPSDLHFE